MSKSKRSEETKNRVETKEIEHDIKVENKGFCSNPYCSYCKFQKII